MSDVEDWFGKQGSKEEEVPSTAFLHHSDRELSSELEPEDLQSECGSSVPSKVPCTANGKVPIASDFEHCPHLQSFVRCGPHHRAELHVLDEDDIAILKRIWRRYQDDLTEPYYEKKPEFSDSDFDDFYSIACKVVNAMVAEYKVPMILDQATISNTNHVGHPPHADNIQFDSVWWKGKKIPKQDEVQAAREGAYVLWRNEKTSYRSYSCSVSLCDPDGYQGGAVQFFRGFGIKEPIARYKCKEGHGIAFCGCHRNIHAVTGVTSGFRLVLLVWTRPPEVRVPESQATVCYFRPGTGLGVWLTTADILRHLSRRAGREGQVWLPVAEDDGVCQCETCISERQKTSWKECLAQGAGTASGKTNAQVWHCPLPTQPALCMSHGWRRMGKVLSLGDLRSLLSLWERYNDDLCWYERKPEYTPKQLADFTLIARKVVAAMGRAFNEELELDQAAVNCTSYQGHPPHADNMQFDSVWWQGQRIRERDEVLAAQGGAHVHFRRSWTAHRNYCASVLLVDPSEYGGGELEFFNTWGEKEPCDKVKPGAGEGYTYCGCQKSIHAVRGVRWGSRMVLLVWTRPKGSKPAGEAGTCYFKPGSGPSIWLTSEDVDKAAAKAETSTRRGFRGRRGMRWRLVVNSELGT